MDHATIGVLIVDASDSDRWAFAHRLEAEPQSFAIRMADSLQNAEAMLEGAPADAALVTTTLMSEADAASWRNRYPEMALVAVAEELSFSLVEKYLAAGVHDVVSPTQTGPRDLNRALQFSIYRSRSQRAQEESIDRERALRGKQRRLIEVVDALDLLVGTADVTGSISYMNASARSFWLEGDAAIDGLDLLSLISPSERDELANKVFPSFLKKGRWDGELPLLAKDGSVVRAEVTMVLHYDEEGSPFFSSIGRLIEPSPHGPRNRRTVDGRVWV